MRLIISDLTDLPRRAGGRFVVPDDTKKIHHCIGCFGCWVKTPGQCVLQDGYGNMGELLGHCGELLVVSECVYGGFSPFVKNVFDRSIPYISPYFVVRNGEMHHKQRYKNAIRFSVHFYGADVTDAEKKTAESIVHANALNFYAAVDQLVFHPSADEIRRALA